MTTNQSMKNHAIIFTLGLLFGLFFSFMCRTLVIDLPKPHGAKQSVVELKKEAESTNAAYAKGFDSLKAQSSVLSSQLHTTKKSLQTVKSQNAQLKSEVSFLIRKHTDKITEQYQVDIPCDSLVTTVEYFMQSNAEKDSLYEAMTTNLTAQVANKDSTITLKKAQYLNLKSTLNKSLSNQQSLVDENELLRKQVRKQKVKGKLLSAALFIISGAAINQLIRR
jgi:2-keto-3-deoxy-galactonokinase